MQEKKLPAWLNVDTSNITSSDFKPIHESRMRYSYSEESVKVFKSIYSIYHEY